MAHIALNIVEVRVIRRGLKRLRYEVTKSVAKNDSLGWAPEPGCLDLGRETLKVVDELLDRLPYGDLENVS